MHALARVTATGVAVTKPTSAAALKLKSITLTPAAAVSTVTVDDSTDGSGTDLLTLQAAANGNSVQWLAADYGLPFFTAIHCTITGASAVVVVEYDNS